MPEKLLIIDDDADVLMAARLLLKRHFGQVDIEKNPDKIPFLLGQAHYDAILLDMNFERDTHSGREGFHWLDRILDLDPTARVILITAYGDVEMAVRALKSGATDFVLKPWENDKLLATIRGAMGGRGEGTKGGEEERRSGGEKERKRGETEEGRKVGEKRRPGVVPSSPPPLFPSPLPSHSLSSSPSLIGDSPGMRGVFETIARVADTDANVLILGENGTGKDLIAREIHRQSLRRAGPFIAADLGALPDSLFESELFGHVKGAFTDARADRTGRFEEANGGTIFLDEIGNIGLPQQARLLTVLQQRTVIRVGSNQPRPIDVRLICATNAPLAEAVADRSFRQDLLYRINTIELRLPALRDRREDIGPLAEHFLKQYKKQYNRAITGLSAAALKQMEQYHWPGNVRELQHAVERAVILAPGRVLEPSDFVFESSAGQTTSSPVLETVQLEDMERRLIQQAMQKHQGNISDMARELGLSRQALYRRLEKFGM